MTREDLITVGNEVMMEEIEEVDLCLICCSKVKNEDNHLNNYSELLSSNLVVFYLLRVVLQVTGIELKKNLIGCGNPVEWIRLCDKCNELTRRAEELNTKLKKIERELSCIQKLIWDKASSSINSEADRKLVKATIDLNRKTNQVWRKIRNHVANKCNLSKERGDSSSVDTLYNPFIEGDKLANYLLTQKASSTAILPRQYSEHNDEDDDDRLKLLEETYVSEATSSSSPLKIEVGVKTELDLEASPPPDHHQNYENPLIENLLGELEEESGDHEKGQELFQEEIANLEEMEVDTLDGGDQLEFDKVKGKDKDWNWGPDEDDELWNEEELEEKNLEKDTRADSGVTKRETEKQPPNVKGPPPSSQKRSSKYIKKGRVYTAIRTEDGKFKCRHCDQTFARLQGCNGHERAKHPKTPGGFVCEICSEAFDCRDYLRKHIKRFHESDGRPPGKNRYRKMIRNQDGKYQCRHCDQTFGARDSVISHEREKHSETPGAFICDICGRAFNSTSYLRGHKFQSHKLKADGTPWIPKDRKSLKKDHICDQCGAGFKTIEQLRRHVRFVHEKRFSIKCTLCGLGWASSCALKKHMLAVHPEEPATKKLVEEEGISLWVCPVVGCQVRFLKEASLKGHLKSKHGKEVEGNLDVGVVLEDPSIKETCQKCGKICRNKAALKKHEEVHENEGKAKEFFCEICGSGFVTKEYLKGHVDRVHLKKGRVKKDFKCELCGKGYRNRYLLKGHMELHEKEGKRDHFCDKCGHGFITDNYLRIHKKRTNCGKEGERARVYNRKAD